MTEKKRTGRKVIEAYTKHEDLIDKAVELGTSHHLNVEATDGNDPKGDIKVAAGDLEDFVDLISKTIKKNQSRRRGDG
jgi:hypothetical protein